MEAVVRTFQQRWRSVNGYKIQNLGDHRVLFVFDNSSDVERIIKNQPWSFEKHLVVLQTFEEFSKLKDLVLIKHCFGFRFMILQKAFGKPLERSEGHLNPQMMMEVTSFGNVSQWILLFLYAEVGCSS